MFIDNSAGPREFGPNDDASLPPKEPTESKKHYASWAGTHTTRAYSPKPEA